MLSGREPQPPNWVYVFTDAPSLSRMALDVAPARAADLGGTQDAVAAAVRRRLARYAPELM